MPVTDSIRNKLSQLPHKPGVYLMKDRFGTVIYVGKARDLRRRVSQYFHPSRRHGWDLKLKALLDAVYDFDVHIVRSEPEALLLEGRLIKEFHPRYNVSFRDDKRFLLLKVNFNDPIPRFTLTRYRQDDGARYFGPFAHSSALRSTLLMVRKKFHLRGCRPLTPGEADYKHCLYAHLKFCTAPCIGNVTREQYLMQVQAACEFLSGQSDEIERQLEEEMIKASKALNFEKAAELRDALMDLRRTTQKTQKFERLPYKLPIATDPGGDLRSLAEALQLPKLPERIEGFDISTISGTFSVASMVSFKNGRPDRSNYRRFKMKTVSGQDDFACMAETIRRRYSRLLKEESTKAEPDQVPVEQAGVAPAQVEMQEVLNDLPSEGDPAPEPARSGFPDLILIDGGKGQLNAALAELKKLGLGHLRVVGLAKEYEELYRPGHSEPLRLGFDSPALKLLQRVRDESHRFANTYNAQLRLKKISESLLDEFPGIGERRKAALLRKFGSIQRLRIAPVEQIAAVPGFGGKTAADLKAFLDARASTSGAPSLGEGEPE